MESKIIAITNQKGGVGKTTTAVNLGTGLARQGKRVLLIDADPQRSLTVSLGIKKTTNGYYLTNRSDAGGSYRGTLESANASWVSNVVNFTLKITKLLPKTGY